MKRLVTVRRSLSGDRGDQCVQRRRPGASRRSVKGTATRSQCRGAGMAPLVKTALKATTAAAAIVCGRRTDGRASDHLARPALPVPTVLDRRHRGRPDLRHDPAFGRSGRRIRRRGPSDGRRHGRSRVGRSPGLVGKDLVTVATSAVHGARRVEISGRGKGRSVDRRSSGRLGRPWLTEHCPGRLRRRGARASAPREWSSGQVQGRSGRGQQVGPCSRSAVRGVGQRLDGGGNREREDSARRDSRCVCDARGSPVDRLREPTADQCHPDDGGAACPSHGAHRNVQCPDRESEPRPDGLGRVLDRQLALDSRGSSPRSSWRRSST